MTVRDKKADLEALSSRLSALPPLPRDDGGPVFAEPWQAQAFALAVRLSEQGHFTWKEWAAALADEIKAATARGEDEDGSRYYHHWLAALERLVAEKGLTNLATMSARKEEWADAYRHTPHGKPVELHRHRPPGRSVMPAFELLTTSSLGSLLGMRHAHQHLATWR